jgi:hypothetical protein
LHNISEIIYSTLWTYPHKIIGGFIAGLTLLSIPFAIRHGIRHPAPDITRTWPVLELHHLPLAAFCVAFGIYLALIPAWEELTYWDSNIFFSTLKDGHQFYPPAIWPGAGRLFPLAHQEFGYLSAISPTIFFYHAFAAAELIALLLLVCTFVNGNLRIGIFCAILTTPAIVQSYFGLIFPERNMVLLLAAIIAGALAWRNRGSLTGFVVASLSGVALLFFKETAFLLTGSIGIVALCAYWLGFRSPSNRNMLILSAVLLISCACWLALYLVAIFPEIQNAYHSTYPVTRWNSFISVANQPWFFALCISLVARGWMLWKKMASVDPLWDGAALAALIYFVAIVALKFDIPYYFAPSAFLAWALVSQLLALWTSRKATAIFILVLISFQLHQTEELIKRKKELVASKADAARFIEESNPINRIIRIHFEKEDPYEAGLFSGFLNAKYGTSVVTILPETPGEKGTRACTPDISMPCSFGLSVDPGDFIMSFGAPISNPTKPLVFVSEPVGFWQNTYRTYIYRSPVK